MGQEMAGTNESEAEVTESSNSQFTKERVDRSPPLKPFGPAYTNRHLCEQCRSR